MSPTLSSNDIDAAGLRVDLAKVASTATNQMTAIWMAAAMVIFSCFMRVACGGCGPINNAFSTASE
jgi:hypothetical protein